MFELNWHNRAHALSAAERKKEKEKLKNIITDAPRKSGKGKNKAVEGIEEIPVKLVTKELERLGYNYKQQNKTLPGKPDITLPELHVAIFIKDCFHYGHKNCKQFVLPKSRTQWWINKIQEKNVNNKEAIARLKKDGWEVISLWECMLIPSKIETVLRKNLKQVNAMLREKELVLV